MGSRGRQREGHDCPAAQARLKMENDAGGWLGCVRPAIGVQGTESEVRALVHEPSVLSPQRQVARKSIIGATSVQEGTSSLSTRTRHGSAKIARGIKDKTPAPGERVSADSSQAQWKFHHDIAGDSVYVGLDSGFPEAAPEIFFSVSVVPIVAFCREPTVEVVTVPDLESSGVGGGSRDSLSVRVLGEKACALQTDLRAVFLSRGPDSHEKGKSCEQNSCPTHRLTPLVLQICTHDSPDRCGVRYENRIPQSVAAPGLPKLHRVGSIPKCLINQRIGQLQLQMDPCCRTISAIGLTHDETDDILQKLSGVFPHQMKHILTEIAVHTLLVHFWSCSLH